MASLPTLNSIEEIKKVLTALNYEFQELHRYPTDAEKPRNTVFYIPKKYAGPKMSEDRYIGTLSFKQKIYDIYPNNCTKVLLEKWLDSSELLDCPICCLQMTTCSFPKSNKIGCSSCGRCGFKACVICILKSVLNASYDEANRTIWKCPNCRNEAVLNVAQFSASMILDNHLKRFHITEQNVIKSLALKSKLYAHYLKESKTVEAMKCSNCQVRFVRKRLKCTGCMTVFYCSKDCQIENWNFAHKPWCRMFAFIQANP